MKKINDLFSDEEIIAKIKEKLPYLFQLAEVDNSRNWKLGMEIWSARERIVIALLIFYFWEEHVDTDICITEAETDVILFDDPISIKTATWTKISWVKLIWTVDPQKALEFQERYYPSCDIIFVQIAWGKKSYMYLYPKEVQEEIINKLWREKYIKLPKQWTNPRGVELSGLAIEELSNHKDTKKIEIEWKRVDMEYTPYDRWIDYWNKS